ncbi:MULTISPECIES: fused MFS/spermidine synthase [unclassified Cryobacterium]|uniref:spermidine synthase n=1 Tax=unclassified Cryobacterium TaxID=2649013 RepID=UPI002AB33E4A|nr:MULTISPECIES: fused MFS/spermidine synthase [unclassified Cryobacterium]MDY7526472.1 fused MFS/spermidine synthase [Cryobacterium sp. 10C2]MDY7557721.1 fused MFS/spermidine synthase [Cryobacterium sp. 10C3]MEB0202322.1 fused MFS/spermidine synthase [Cryobacterium sp. 5I3]MEB0287794.1 fused MFS/spermidine synthase [Cryobacterium sp. 10S3]MEB0291132.1 fused MFS/spermidine synthase [Cryobacterium sp. 10C2]
MSRSEVQHPSVTLKLSGLTAEIVPDRFVPGSFELIVDGTPQSHVNIDNPGELFFEYVQRIGHVIDLLGDVGEAITAVHLGAGALTLPRYVEATRPGSRQQVVEIESDLIDFVRAELPWDKRANLRVRHGDAREVLAKLPAGLHGTTDLVVVDIFSGARTPAHVTSREFYELARPLLSPRGVLVLNVADGPGLAFARAQAATLSAVFPHVIGLAETQVLKGRRFGNIVLVATLSPVDLTWVPRLLAGGPHPAKVVEGAELRQFMAAALVTTDATATPSPLPGRTVFQIGN